MGRPDKHKSLVHRILLDSRDARNSDRDLWVKVIKEVKPELAKLPFEVAIKSADMPSYESITRRRRDWQAKDPDCMSDIQIARERAKRELDFREEYGNG